MSLAGPPVPLRIRDTAAYVGLRMRRPPDVLSETEFYVICHWVARLYAGAMPPRVLAEVWARSALASWTMSRYVPGWGRWRDNRLRLQTA
jgi:hypothetical protein